MLQSTLVGTEAQAPLHSTPDSNLPKMIQPAIYQSYRGLPPLAGLCSLQRAAENEWSLEASVERLKRLHYVLRRR